METTKRVRDAFRVRSLFASALPVVLTIGLLRISHRISLLRADAWCAVLAAVLVQMLANLNAVYSTFHRAFQPQPNASVATSHSKKKTAASDKGDDNKIVVNLLSQKVVRVWSWALFAAIIALVGAIHVTGRRKTPHSAGGSALLGVLSFLYCRRVAPLPLPGLQELLFAIALGPVAMFTTSLLLVGAMPAPVVFYAHVVLFFALGYQTALSALDAPYVRRLGLAGSSMALSLGYERTFQMFVLTLTLAYGLLMMSVVFLGHLPNLLLVMSLAKVRDLSDAFREEQLRGLPDRVAALGAVLGGGLVCSIALSSAIV
ncbi:hypothetical protein P43SY_002973 [Pythium insidiosum]|uniref:Uncharacterized protein n=1 Tax=Pythium insidiosum TaxID=114742 RepID=A0AAD5LZC0_PYTIN|nr:hypothetical protein P43SY_002973 [Pythium insidiosum]